MSRDTAEFLATPETDAAAVRADLVNALARRSLLPFADARARLDAFSTGTLRTIRAALDAAPTR